MCNLGRVLGGAVTKIKIPDIQFWSHDVRTQILREAATILLRRGPDGESGRPPGHSAESLRCAELYKAIYVTDPPEREGFRKAIGRFVAMDSSIKPWYRSMLLQGLVNLRRQRTAADADLPDGPLAQSFAKLVADYSRDIGPIPSASEAVITGTVGPSPPRGRDDDIMRSITTVFPPSLFVPEWRALRCLFDSDAPKTPVYFMGFRRAPSGRSVVQSLTIIFPPTAEGLVYFHNWLVDPEADHLDSIRDIEGFVLWMPAGIYLLGNALQAGLKLITLHPPQYIRQGQKFFHGMVHTLHNEVPIVTRFFMVRVPNLPPGIVRGSDEEKGLAKRCTGVVEEEEAIRNLSDVLETLVKNSQLGRDDVYAHDLPGFIANNDADLNVLVPNTDQARSRMRD